MKGLTLSVSQLNEYVRKTLAADPMTQHLCVTGEISNLKRHVSGHWYFTLKDEDAAINCVMFRQAAGMVRFHAENGMSVRLFGSVGLYAKTGSYQFYGDMMEQEGIGELFLRFEALKNKLLKEGLFDAGLKKPLPLLPRGIGIITSKTGAVVHDIQTVAWRRNPSMPLYLCSVKVQGQDAAAEIAAAIRRMDRFEKAEVLIVGRGGGSMEDLWPFNEEAVARAIAACHTPIVSAVGHETDFTIADFVADLRAPTPSAAAELCVQDRESLRYALLKQRERMERTLSYALENGENRLKRLRERVALHEPAQLARQQGLCVERLRQRLETAMAFHFQTYVHRLEQATLRLTSVGPMAALSRGYGLVTKEGKLLRSVREAEPGDRLCLRLLDGSLGVRVEDKETGEAHGWEEDPKAAHL